jgi:hypothetical protein
MLQGMDRMGLAGLGGIGPVAGKRHLTEPRRRIEPIEEFIHGNCRCAGSELFDLYQGGPFCWSLVPSKNTGKAWPARVRDCGPAAGVRKTTFPRVNPVEHSHRPVTSVVTGLARRTLSAPGLLTVQVKGHRNDLPR